MCDKIPPGDNSNLVEIYASSARLEMKELLNMTAGILMEKITLENANVIMKFGHDELRMKAFEELKKNFDN